MPPANPATSSAINHKATFGYKTGSAVRAFARNWTVQRNCGLSHTFASTRPLDRLNLTVKPRQVRDGGLGRLKCLKIRAANLWIFPMADNLADCGASKTSLALKMCLIVSEASKSDTIRADAVGCP